MKNQSNYLVAALALSISSYATSATGNSQSANVESNHQNPHATVDAYPVEQVLKSIYTDHDMTYFAEADGMDMSISVRSKPQGKTVFEGKSVQHSISEVVLSIDDSPLFAAESTFYYDTQPFLLKGSEMPNQSYSVVTKSIKLPKYANIGDSGVYAQEVTFEDSNKTKKVNSNVYRWSLNQATDTTAFLCDSIESDAISYEHDETGKACYEITQQGEVVGGYAKINNPIGEEGEQLDYVIVVN